MWVTGKFAVIHISNSLGASDCSLNSQNECLKIIDKFRLENQVKIWFILFLTLIIYSY